MGFAQRFLAIGLFLLAPGCAVALVGAGAAVGIWAYDEHSNDGGEIVVGHPPERVYDEAVFVLQARGSEVTTSPGALRVTGEVEDSDVTMQVFLVPGNENVARLKVTARSLLKGEPELAKSLGLDVQQRLK